MERIIRERQRISEGRSKDIYAYDLSARKERQITSDPSDQIQPVIYNNTIAWVDRRRGGWDIYIYDLSTNREGRITSTKVLT